MKTSCGFGLTSLKSTLQKQTDIAHEQCFHLSEWGKLHVFLMLKGLVDLSCSLSITPSTRSCSLPPREAHFIMRNDSHLSLCLCSRNQGSHQPRSRATQHPQWDWHQSRVTLSPTDHKVNTTSLFPRSYVCTWLPTVAEDQEFVFSASSFFLLVYVVFRKRKNSTWFCSSLSPTQPPAMIITPATRKHFLCHLQFTKETWTRAKKERQNSKNPEVGGN